MPCELMGSVIPVSAIGTALQSVDRRRRGEHHSRRLLALAHLEEAQRRKDIVRQLAADLDMLIAGDGTRNQMKCHICAGEDLLYRRFRIGEFSTNPTYPAQQIGRNIVVIEHGDFRVIVNQASR